MWSRKIFSDVNRGCKQQWILKFLPQQRESWMFSTTQWGLWTLQVVSLQDVQVFWCPRAAELSFDSPSAVQLYRINLAKLLISRVSLLIRDRPSVDQTEASLERLYVCRTKLFFCSAGTNYILNGRTLAVHSIFKKADEWGGQRTCSTRTPLTVNWLSTGKYPLMEIFE